MANFKITKGNWFELKTFSSETAAQNYANSKGVGYLVEPYIEPVQATPLQVIINRKNYGEWLENKFLEDNALRALYLYNNNQRASPFFTETETSDLADKFAKIITYCNLGSIRQVLDVLPSIPTDEIFTQERKDDYIAMITDYLSI